MVLETKLLKRSFLVAAMLLSGFSGIAPKATAQTLPVGDLREEQLRIQQLIHGTEYSSFTNRPIWKSVYDNYMDLAERQPGWWNRRLEMSLESFYLEEIDQTIRIGVYDPLFRTTGNSNVPYGENNAAAWYGRGFNTEFEAGVWLSSDYFTVSFRPHYTFQQNADFEIPRFIPENGNGEPRYVAEGIGDRIDRPFRFGPNSFTTSSWGHSSIRVHYKQFEVGLSNEPLWWGGNVKYPLVMSNNAPGMRHVFGGTREPFRIPYVGAFEFRWMGGWPKDSDYFDQEEYQHERFMNAMNISFSPQYIPNLHIGLTRVYHFYIEEGLRQSDIFVIFDPFQKKNLIEKRGDDDERKPRNQLASVYARWVWPQERIEIYGEFFREDHSWDWRDFMMEPRHNSGYAFGVQKLFNAPLAEMYRVNMEFTNMTPSALQEVRPQTYFYTHSHIRQGHTNRGQVLGAAIGPGSNSQFFSLDAFTDHGRFGIFVRRLADNNHFHMQFDRSLNRPEEWRQGFGDYWRNRTDLTIGGNFLYGIGPVWIAGELSWTKLYNYGRFDYGQFGGLNIANFEPYDVTNVQAQLMVRYQF